MVYEGTPPKHEPQPGTRHGDPISPAYFSLVSSLVVDPVVSQVPGAVVMMYADDLVIFFPFEYLVLRKFILTYGIYLPILSKSPAPPDVFLWHRAAHPHIKALVQPRLETGSCLPHN